MLSDMEGKVFKCHTIMNCVRVCPKGLNPAKAIQRVKNTIIYNGYHSKKRKEVPVVAQNN